MAGIGCTASATAQPSSGPRQSPESLRSGAMACPTMRLSSSVAARGVTRLAGAEAHALASAATRLQRMRRLSITSWPASHGPDNGSTNAPRAPDCPGAREFSSQPIAARLLATTAEVEPQPDQARPQEHERPGFGHGAVYLADHGGAADVEHLEEDVVVIARIERGQVDRGVAHVEDVAEIVVLVILTDTADTGARERREGIGMRSRVGAAHGDEAAVRARRVLVIVTVTGHRRERRGIDGDRRRLGGAGRVLGVRAIEAEAVADQHLRGKPYRERVGDDLGLVANRAREPVEYEHRLRRPQRVGEHDNEGIAVDAGGLVPLVDYPIGVGVKSDVGLNEGGDIV